MQCEKCGATVADGSKFCSNCGWVMPAEVPIGITPPASESEKKKKGGGGFLSSPAGIALVVILAIAVIAGITFGVIFLVKSNANNTVDAETVKVWDEYESMLTEDSKDVPQITMD